MIWVNETGFIGTALVRLSWRWQGAFVYLLCCPANAAVMSPAHETDVSPASRQRVNTKQISMPVEALKHAFW